MGSTKVDLGGSQTPASNDARWAAWARPLAALLRLGPRTREACASFCRGFGAPSHKAWNLLSWLELEGFTTGAPEAIALTASGRAWLGDYRLPPASVEERRDPRDLRGPPFGRLVAEEPDGYDATGCLIWRCRCRCGQTHRTSSRALRSGRVQSCGCLRRDMGRLREHAPSGRWRAAS